MTNNSNFGPDPSRWSSSKMTGVGLTIAGGVAAAVGGVVMNLLDRRRRPVFVSAKAVRLTNEQFMAADIALMELRLKHAQTERNEAETRAAEAESNLAQERLARSRSRR
jgi:hypothetical protein